MQSHTSKKLLKLRNAWGLLIICILISIIFPQICRSSPKRSERELNCSNCGADLKKGKNSHIEWVSNSHWILPLYLYHKTPYVQERVMLPALGREQSSQFRDSSVEGAIKLTSWGWGGVKHWAQNFRVKPQEPGTWCMPKTSLKWRRQTISHDTTWNPEVWITMTVEYC